MIDKSSRPRSKVGLGMGAQDLVGALELWVRTTLKSILRNGQQQKEKKTNTY